MLCLVTAVTSPVGRKVAAALLGAGYQVLGVADTGAHSANEAANHVFDSFLPQQPGLLFCETDLCCRSAVMQLFAQHQPDIVLHLGGRSGLCFLDKNNQHCVDASQRMMQNLLEAAVKWQSRHYVYTQAVALYSDCLSGRARHQASLHQVESRQQLLAHTYSAMYRLYTTGLCLSMQSQESQLQQPCARYYGRERIPLALQLLRLVKTGPVFAEQANPYFALYQAADHFVTRWGGRKKRPAQPQVELQDQQTQRVTQHKFSQ
ncbi:NAD-dependent epimerase/dehydratase family protein [Rheinheimera texasensis]|uniref:NAD-dependent epimerase/dehydratase family protein n=1 Tax=Rheinheimera texasensis TaxID=306205 RepID=UPI0004E16A66|nr:NAD-dependent epimerase/dehydratase family protein [Rheinheimera texasensis]